MIEPTPPEQMGHLPSMMEADLKNTLRGRPTSVLDRAIYLAGRVRPCTANVSEHPRLWFSSFWLF
jgi:hypothetical protein